jgi:leucyl aminopeptidase (aminopeptidase T)
MRAIENLFTINLRVRKDEKVLIFTDTINDKEKLSLKEKERREKLPLLAKQIQMVGEKYCHIFFFSYPALRSHGKEPPKEIWEEVFGKENIKKIERFWQKIEEKNIKKDEEKTIKNTLRSSCYNAFIALANFSTTHTLFRHILTDVCGTKYASMPLFDEQMFSGPMAIDWQKMWQRTEKVKKLLEGTKMVEVFTPQGTHLEIYLNGRDILSDTGDLSKRGSCSNLPAGEVYFAPKEGKTRGTMIIEYSPTTKLKHPLILHIEKGNLLSIEGNDLFKERLKDVFERIPLAKNIAELGIGTNDKAKRADNILEAEKILGTVHIAFGDNASFGGNVSVPFHEDYIQFYPTVVLHKETGNFLLLQGGELCI